MRLNIHKGEWYATVLSFLYYFFILAAYYVIRPMRDQLAVELGSHELPWFFAGTFAATLLLTPLFGWIVSRWPRRIVMPLVNLFFIACQLIFILLYNHPDWLSIETLGLLFFLWVSVFNLFVVSVFWSFMADIWDDPQACRLFPIIALGGSAGAVAGPYLTGHLIGIVGFSSILALSAALLLAAVACIFLLGSWAHRYGVHRKKPGSEKALGGGIWDGVKQIFSNRFIGIMSLMMLLGDAIGTIAYVIITDYSGAAFPGNTIAQTRFAAELDLTSNIIQIIVQLIVTRWLLVRFGASIAFALWGIIIVSVCLTMVLVGNPYGIVFGTIPWVGLVQIVNRSLSYGIIQPARETLYTLVSRDLRYKGKNAVDTVVWRAGDVASSSLINVLRHAGVAITGFGLIWAGLAAASGWMGFYLSRRVEKGEFNKIQ